MTDKISDAGDSGANGESGHDDDDMPKLLYSNNASENADRVRKARFADAIDVVQKSRSRFSKRD